MPGIRRTVCTSWSSNGWLVVIAALKGLVDAFAAARSFARIARDPAIMPTAKTPTAIESTTRMVRVLLLVRSARTLRQRGLSIVHLYFRRRTNDERRKHILVRRSSFVLRRLADNLPIGDNHS